MTLLCTERSICREFVFIQQQWLALWINPYIEQKIDLFNHIGGDVGRFRNIAVPALVDSVFICDIKNIEPAISIVVFGKAIIWFKLSVAQITSGHCPACLNDHAMCVSFNDFALILDFYFSLRI